MKLILSLALLMSAASSFACSPAPATVMQQMNLQRVLSSESFAKEIQAQRNNDFFVSIEKIEFNQTVDVVLSNGCTISSQFHWSQVTEPGMCPQFKYVSSVTNCQ